MRDTHGPLAHPKQRHEVGVVQHLQLSGCNSFSASTRPLSQPRNCRILWALEADGGPKLYNDDVLKLSGPFISLLKQLLVPAITTRCRIRNPALSGYNHLGIPA
jgi:hypothetical protein